jgi:hypothetical protein
VSNYEYFELRRLSDGLVYQFDRSTLPDGSTGYRRRDMDLWITFKRDLGWVAFDEASGSVLGRPWNVLPQLQTDHPPEGEWVSKKGIKSYVYELVYCAPPPEP